MASKSLSPEQIAQAVCLRAAGYTVTAISDRLGTSVRTLHRVFERYGATKGAVNAALLEAVKLDLIESVTSNDRIREEAAKLVADDLAHARLLREKLAVAAEFLVATNLEEAALAMRAAAAYSTALKNTSDMVRQTLRTDRSMDEQRSQDLPELVVREITGEEISRVVHDRAQDASLGFDLQVEEGNGVILED